MSLNFDIGFTVQRIWIICTDGIDIYMPQWTTTLPASGWFLTAASQCRQKQWTIAAPFGFRHTLIIYTYRHIITYITYLIHSGFVRQTLEYWSVVVYIFQMNHHLVHTLKITIHAWLLEYCCESPQIQYSQVPIPEFIVTLIKNIRHF